MAAFTHNITTKQIDTPEHSYSTLYPVLLFVWIVLTLPSLGIAPLFDYDEAVYAQTAVEMKRSGNWLLPYANGQQFFEKPPFMYYVMDASFALFGRNAFAARVPSVLFTLATALFLWHMGRRLERPKPGMTAALIYLSMLMPALLAHTAIMDAALNFWLTVSIMSFFLWLHSGRRRDAVLSMLAAGIAVSVKGPVGVVIPVLVTGTYLALEKDLLGSLRRFPWARGIAVFLLGALPWYVLIVFTHGVGFLKEFILVHNLGRFAQPMEGHGGGWYYYLLVLIPSTLPWLAWLPWWGRQTTARWKETDALDRLARLGMVWTVAVTVLFSFAQTKLPHYISSIYPAVALGIASQWHLRPPATSSSRTASLLLLIICLPLASALLLLPEFYPHFAGALTNPKAVGIVSQEIRPGAWISATGALLSVSLLSIVWLMRRAQPHAALTAFILFGLLLQGALVWSLAPFAGRLVQGPLLAIARQIRTAPASEPVYSLVNYPSVSFYSGRSYSILSSQEALDRLAVASTPYWLIARNKHVAGLSRLPLKVVFRQGDFALLRYSRNSGRTP